MRFLKISALIACIAVGFGASGQLDTSESRIFHTDPLQFLSSDSLYRPNRIQASIAGFYEQDVRESPGRVIIITSDEIRNSGSSDLMTFLMSIPGIALGRDVDDVIGIGMRGLWTNEGKCQFMINGIPLNEFDYGTFALGNRISLDNVSRIEIMNGPGSVVYGGMAALGVINIITKENTEGESTTLKLRASTSNGYISDKYISLNGNNRIGRQTFISYTCAFQDALRSTWKNRLMDGQTIAYGDSTATLSQFIHLNFRSKGLRYQFLVSDYNYQVSDQPYGIAMRNLINDLEYTKQLNEKFDIRIRANVTYQMPWFNINTTDPDLIASNTTAKRSTVTASVNYKLNEVFQWNTGVQAYHQKSEIYSKSPDNVFNINQQGTILIEDAALFSEMNLRTRIGNFTSGGRVESNTLAGTLFAPRCAYTFVKKAFHTKLLFSRAFKIPTLQNVNFGPESEKLHAETVQTEEVELGYQLTFNTSVAANIFRNTIINPIVYVYNNEETDNYINRPGCGTKGFEISLRTKGKSVSARAGYSYYSAVRSGDLPEIELPGNLSNQYLALPQHKGSLHLSYRPRPLFRMNADLICQSGTYTYVYSDTEQEDLVLTKIPPSCILNLSSSFSVQKLEQLSFSLNWNNVLRQKLQVASPYNNGLSPIPLISPEFTLSIQYKFS